jgi:3-oxoacyl-[acyl-carrier protein] reductase
MSHSKRIEQVANHLNYPKGLLAGQVAIITGSGQGIGAEAARLFANEGAKVVVSDVDASKHAKSPLEAESSAEDVISPNRQSLRSSPQN